MRGSSVVMTTRESGNSLQAFSAKGVKVICTSMDQDVLWVPMDVMVKQLQGLTCVSTAFV